MLLSEMAQPKASGFDRLLQAARVLSRQVDSLAFLLQIPPNKSPNMCPDKLSELGNFNDLKFEQRYRAFQ